MRVPSAILDQLDTYGPEQCAQLGYDEAVRYTQQLAETHYENFSVVSWLLPKRLREGFRNVYSFCRWADDLADETGDPQRSLELLAWWRDELDKCYAGRPRHPVYVALSETIKRHDIPRKPFDDLIDAFVQDQTVTRYDTWEQVCDYCTRSADPVGRLVLYLCGYRDEFRQRLSDHTCTALQLANFWQDVRRDVVERDRVYIPAEVASRHGLSIEQMVKTIRIDAECRGEACCAAKAAVEPAGVRAILPAYRATVRELVDRTRPMFTEGRKLWPTLERDIRRDIQLFTLGGEAILRMIKQVQCNTLVHRPKLGKVGKLMLIARVGMASLFEPAHAQSPELAATGGAS